MTTFYRALVTGRDATSPFPSDVVTNTLHFEDRGATTNPTTLANDLWALYAAQTQWMRGLNELEVRFYNLEDAEPRPIKASKKGTIAGGAGSAPRELCLCLSFHGGRSLPRERGRIYLGPLTGSAAGGARPSQTVRDAAIALADGLANLGGIDVSWNVYSPTKRSLGASIDDSFTPVKYAWCDDEFDIIRSRGMKPTTRSAKNYSE